MTTYQYPEFSVGDYVSVRASKDKHEDGFVIELIPRRNDAKEFVEWTYKVARLNNDTVTEHTAGELRAKMIVMRQYVRSV